MYEMNEIYQATRNVCVNAQEQAAYHAKFAAHYASARKTPTNRLAAIKHQEKAAYFAKEAWIRLERLI